MAPFLLRECGRCEGRSKQAVKRRSNRAFFPAPDRLLERRALFGDIGDCCDRSCSATPRNVQLVSAASLFRGDKDVAKSVLEAIKQGVWDFEPERVDEQRFQSTRAMPGTDEKLEVLAERVRAGLPLWHGSDRTDFDEQA